MTKSNFTSINVILDESGSMDHLQEETIKGVNTFISEQNKVPGDAIFTLAKFDHDYILVHDCVPLATVPELTSETYKPRGYTALLDALGKTINATGAKLAAMQEHERPSKVVFLVITDGEENSSKDFSHSKVKEMVEHQTSKYNWEFIFMGASGMDAIDQGSKMGFSSANSYNYSSTRCGTATLYSSISDSMTASRTTGNVFAIDPNALKDDATASSDSDKTS